MYQSEETKLPDRHKQPTVKQSIITLLFFLSLAIVLTWPLVYNLSTHLPFGTDSIVHYWNSWWVAQAFAHGQSPYQTDLLFAPAGLSLVYHNFAWLHIVFGLPLSQILSLPASYNLVLLFNLALCGCAATLVVFRLTRQPAAALLAGVIYLSWPYRLTQPDHPNLHSTWPIPLFLLTLINLLAYRRKRDAVFCGLAFALVGYMRWQLLIPAVVIGLLYTFVFMFQSWREHSWASLNSALWPLVLSAVIGIALLAPPMLLLAREWGSNPAQLVPQGEEIKMQTDLLAYLTPPPWHSIVGETATSRYATFYPDRGSRAIFSPYIGYTTLVLIGIALYQLSFKWTAPWLFMIVVLILLAMGPTVRINGRQYENVVTLYTLFNDFWVFRLLREPDRFNMFLALPVAILAGFGSLSLISSSRWLICLLGAIVLLETIVVPLPLQAIEQSGFYAQLQRLEGNGAILDIPLDPFKSKPYMLAQITHGRPIAAGHASRYPAAAFDKINDQPWLTDTLLFDGQPPNLKEFGRELHGLHELGFEFLVLHKEMIETDYLQKWGQMVPLEPYFEDDDLIVFQLAPAGFNSILDHPEIDPGLHMLGQTLSATCNNPAGVLGLDLTWGTTDEVSLEWGEVQLVLTQDEQKEILEPKPLGASAPSIQPITFTHAWYEWDLAADLSPGVYGVALHRYDPNLGLQDRLFQVTPNLLIQNETCVFPTAHTQTEVNAKLGDIAYLLGYDLSQSIDELLLSLEWRSQQHTGQEYTVFVHLYEAQTNQIVSQHDGMPKNWTYPTSRWGLDETITEAIRIDLTDVPAGRYDLALGLYNASSGERLEIVDQFGDQQPDGRLFLQTIEIK